MVHEANLFHSSSLTLCLSLSALNQLRLPVIFKRGKLGELRINVPWHSIQTEPIQVKIINLEVELGNKPDQQQIQEPGQPSQANTATNLVPPANTPSTPQQSESWVASWMNAIKANVAVTLQNLVATYSVSTPPVAPSTEPDVITAHFSCQSGSFFAVNENWEKAFANPGPENVRRNECLLRGLSCRISRAGLEEDGSNHFHLTYSIMLLIIVIIDLVFSNANCRIRLLLYPEAAQRTKYIDIYFDQLDNVSLSFQQYADLNSLIKSLTSSRKNKIKAQEYKNSKSFSFSHG